MVDLGSPRGRAQAFVRPAVLLCLVGETVVVLPLTSNPNAARFKHTLHLVASKYNGLVTDSIGLGFQITTIDQAMIIHKIGKLSASERTDVNKLLTESLKV